VLFAGVSWWNSRLTQTQGGPVSAGNSVKPNAPAPAVPPSDSFDEATLVCRQFYVVAWQPAARGGRFGHRAVGMQRGALSALGLPVDEERVSDWIQVDLLVGRTDCRKQCVCRNRRISFSAN